MILTYVDAAIFEKANIVEVARGEITNVLLVSLDKNHLLQLLLLLTTCVT